MLKPILHEFLLQKVIKLSAEVNYFPRGHIHKAPKGKTEVKGKLWH